MPGFEKFMQDNGMADMLTDRRWIAQGGRMLACWAAADREATERTRREDAEIAQSLIPHNRNGATKVRDAIVAKLCPDSEEAHALQTD